MVLCAWCCVPGALVLVDALRPLCDKGPQVDPRYLWDYTGLVAGVDAVAATRYFISPPMPGTFGAGIGTSL